MTYANLILCLNDLARVNAVDVIYAAMPIYLYLNPAILGYLLSPLLTYQESVQYQNNFAAEDLGLFPSVLMPHPGLMYDAGGPFPNATGNFASHDTKIEREPLNSFLFFVRLIARFRVGEHAYNGIGACADFRRWFPLEPTRMLPSAFCY